VEIIEEKNIAIDFPAAHSMDTTWFAIDADGCVGIFGSNEGGAVPEYEYSQQTIKEIETDLHLVARQPEDPIKSIYDDSHLIEVLLETNGGILDRNSIDVESILVSMSMEILLAEIYRCEHPDPILDSKRSRKPRHDKINRPIHLSSLFLLVQISAIIPAEQCQVEVIIELPGDNIIIYSQHCELPWLKSAIEAGVVLSGTKPMNLDTNLSLFGWYRYNCHEQYAAPYYGEQFPKNPIYLKNLPSAIIRNLNRLAKFPNLRFARTSEIQPVEQIPCYIWGSGWEGTNGKWNDE
jgi:hypothetical protein